MKKFNSRFAVCLVPIILDALGNQTLIRTVGER